VTAQPLRVGGLAFVCALATATLVLVAMLGSQLVLSTVAALGLVHAAPPAQPATVQGALVSAETHKARCERHPRVHVERCRDQRSGAGAARP